MTVAASGWVNWSAYLFAGVVILCIVGVGPERRFLGKKKPRPEPGLCGAVARI